MADNEVEDDYMSDTFLVETESTKPGLLARKMPPSAVKQIEKEKRIQLKNDTHKKKFRPLSEIEREHRDEKLTKALDSSNKGFAMLAKMGFKEGSGLGKYGTGRSEPVPIEIKVDRGGLGQEAILKRRKEMHVSYLKSASKRRKVMEEKLRGDFKDRMKGRFMDKQVMFDVRNSQKACQQLDTTKKLEPLESWFWPITVKEKDEEDSVEEEEDEDQNDEPEDTEKLERITEYLRVIHLYCIWCGTTYNDEDDLNKNCPGNSFDSHND